MSKCITPDLGYFSILGFVWQLWMLSGWLSIIESIVISEVKSYSHLLRSANRGAGKIVYVPGFRISTSKSGCVCGLELPHTLNTWELAPLIFRCYSAWWYCPHCLQFISILSYFRNNRICQAWCSVWILVISIVLRLGIYYLSVWKSLVGFCLLESISCAPSQWCQILVILKTILYG